MEAQHTMRRNHPDNSNTWLETTGPWDIPYRARVLCADGRYRIAYTAQSADTWFSLPARVKVKGKTITGYVTTADWEHVETWLRRLKNDHKLVVIAAAQAAKAADHILDRREDAALPEAA